MDGYSGGRIKRIKIQNFMTYDDVEIYPKKGLNLIVGLNGSGKSSIMCAICLGLAGKPHYTGRAKSLSDFIKHGHQEAEIEIELESCTKNDVVIHRKLKGDKCEWTLNGSPSNQNEVASAVKRFNIDTSNLCQFLPQEKVVEFSSMDKKQRLENMLQAIGEPRLFQLFNELKELYKRVVDVEQSVKKYHNIKYAAEEENDRIIDEVQKQENRARLKKELDELLKHKKTAVYQEVRLEVQKLKELQKKLSDELEIIRKEENEATVLEKTILESYEGCSQKYQQSTTTKKNILTEMNTKQNALVNFKAQIENAKIEYRNKLKEKEDQKKRLYDLTKQIEGLERLLRDEMANSQGYDEQVRQNAEALKQLQEEIVELIPQREKASVEKNKAYYSLMQLKGQLSSLQDEQNKKMENLKRRDKYTYQAACWLLENRSRFRGNVYLPIMLEISINSSENAKYVENSIAFRDMIAFVCEDKGDCERLTEILKRQQNLPVNIVMAPDPCKYESPVLSQEHRQCGLSCFVSDLITAPEPVMRYLCRCYSIHNIPVSTTMVPSNRVEFILKTYKTFFAENMKFIGRVSRYGNRNLSVRKDFISVQNLLINTNDENLREMTEKCHVLEEELAKRTRVLEEIVALEEEKEKCQGKLRQEKKMMQDKKKEIERLKCSYSHKQKYLSKLSVVIDEEEEKKKVIKVILSINDFREEVLGDLKRFFMDFRMLEKEIVRLAVSMNIFSRDLKLTQAANEDVRDKVKTAETSFEKATEEYRTKKRQGRKLLDEIKALGPVSVEMSMDEIEEKINHIQAQLNLNEDNEPLVAEFNARKRKIEKIQAQIDSFQGNADGLKREIREKKKEWLRPLKTHIENINKKFSHYFKELNCAGEISLDIPDNNDDFANYGLQINLKFHDEEASLCELSQNRHSGGECSVAAIVFILSLQELTEVPFRCIDEINQGMDSVNERKIYQLIADSVADDRCSQYFLLTPKLLMDLEYPEDVAVHIIFNSPFLNIKLDVKKHLRIAQQQNMAS